MATNWQATSASTKTESCASANRRADRKLAVDAALPVRSNGAQPERSDPTMSAPEIYSPGLEGVIAGETAVSTVEGGLRYRGYQVEELCERCSFEEVAY